MLQGKSRVFKPVENLASRSRAHRCGSDYPPAVGVGNDIPSPAPQPEINAECHRVRESFKDQVRMEPEGTEVKINRERHEGVSVSFGVKLCQYRRIVNSCSDENSCERGVEFGSVVKYISGWSRSNCARRRGWICSLEKSRDIT